MSRFPVALLLVLSWAFLPRPAFAEAKCPAGNAPIFEEDLRATASCEAAHKLHDACSWGSSGDVALSGAVIEKCEAVFLSRITPAQKRNYLARQQRRSRIVEEHCRRKGDHVVGGSSRVPQMTAYRQQALVVAHALASTPSRPRDLRILAPDAAKIVQGNVYGWFERIERGLYGLTSSGRVALVTWANHVSARASA